RRSRAHRARHPFPTRRSSDLGPRPHLLEHNTQFAEQLSNYHIRAFVKPGITGLAQIRGLRGEARNPADIAQRVASDISYLENWKDRKSTRLNSSHVSISYAVF